MKNHSRPVVIAHRGASGYLPEHTLAAKTLAFAMGADFLEQDIVATKDDELVVLHDIYIDRVSNVADVFPDRRREDGRYYVRDLTLAEIGQLSIWERFNADGSVVYPGRYPGRTGEFRAHSLRDELELVRDLNSTAGHTVGIYPEIKRPAWHRGEGVDISVRVLEILAEFGYADSDDNIYLQCFDATESARLRNELGCRLPLVQLIGDNAWGESATDYDELQGAAGLERIAAIVDGIGPWLPQCYSVSADTVKAGTLVARAHRLGLKVHPYTVRVDALPDGFMDAASLFAFLADTLQVDGIFTDFPDFALRAFAAEGDSR